MSRCRRSRASWPPAAPATMISARRRRALCAANWSTRPGHPSAVTDQAWHNDDARKVAVELERERRARRSRWRRRERRPIPRWVWHCGALLVPGVVVHAAAAVTGGCGSMPEVFCQFQGGSSCSALVLVRPETIRSSKSASQDCGRSSTVRGPMELCLPRRTLQRPGLIPCRSRPRCIP